MKSKKYIIISLLAFLFVCGGSELKAQVGDPSFGIRTGTYNGFSFRALYENDRALEGVLGRRNGGLVLSVRSLSYNPMNTRWGENLKWYYGIGIHAGRGYDNGVFENLDLGFDNWDSPEKVFVSGLNAALGLEYRFMQYPFSVGAEITPHVELRKLRKVRFGNPGLSFTVRYHIRSRYYDSFSNH